MSARLNEPERQLLREVADELDAYWDLDAARGLRDSRDGAEYRRISKAPELRALAGERA